MPHRLGLILAGAALAAAQETGGLWIFRPTDQSLLAPGPVQVIARTTGKGELRLDGKPVASTQLAPTALIATVQTTPGRHELTLVDNGREVKVSFAVKGGEASDWPLFRPHPPATGCEACHAVKAGQWAFRNDALSTSCFACHEAKAFPGIHTHNAEVLAECQMCHQPHGSTAAKHLKLRKDLACKQCHG